MLADLSDLNAAVRCPLSRIWVPHYVLSYTASWTSFETDTRLQQEAEAALALVNANKSLSPPPDLSKRAEQHERHHHRASSASAIISWTASPAKFDKFGRRILSPPTTRSTSPHSGTPGTPGSSTPRREEDDIARATSLRQLYEIRAQLKQQDTSSLNRARERINAIQARHQLAHTSADRRETAESSQNRFTYPRAAS